MQKRIKCATILFKKNKHCVIICSVLKGIITENKYSRKQPIKKFDLNQTMYSLVTNEAKNDLDLKATGFIGNSLTYKELFESADTLANSFYNSGVREDDNVAIMTINIPIVQQCLLSLSKLGASMSWIDLRTKSKDLARYIKNCNSKVIVIFEDMLPVIEEIIDEINVERIVVVSPKDYLSTPIKMLAKLKDKKEGKEEIAIPSDKRFVRFADFMKEGKNLSLVETANFKKDKKSLIVQSSGSTGKPKQIVHTEYNFNSEIQKMAYADLPFYKGNTMHISVPPFIIYGLGNSVYSSMAFTMKAEMNPYVDETIVYKDLGKFDISLAAPLHYRYIYSQMNNLEKEIKELQNLNDSESKKLLKSKMKELSRVLKGLERAKVFVSGGDKIGAEELIEMQQKFDKAIVNGYGNNECLGATIVSPMFANRPGSIGVPMKGVEIKIVDPETGLPVKRGEVGELKISSDNLFVEYLNNPEETKKIKEQDEEGKEWVDTGDLCFEDIDRFLFTKGRSRRVIRKEAFKISPDTIEDAIMSLPYVKECVVVGVDDEKSISLPMAFLELEDGVHIEDVIEQIKKKCISELPDYEVPSYYEQLDRLPYTGNNKYDFRKLEAMGNEIVSQKEQAKLEMKK